MSDMMPAELLCALGDLGVDMHLVDGDSAAYDPVFFSDNAAQDVLHKIQMQGADISERDAVSGAFKTFIPPHFRPQPQMPIGQNKTILQLNAQQPIAQRNISHNPPIKGQKPYKRIVQQAPLNADMSHIDVKRPIDAALKSVTDLCATLYDVDDVVKAAADYQSETVWQKLAPKSVFFDGDADADILLIGDMPSKQDEQHDKPLSGAADHIISQTMKYALPSDKNIKVAKCNALFWRSLNPNSHNHYYPLCVPFIKRLIHIMQPKHIILLGALPASLLTDAKGTMMSLRGTSQKIKIEGQDFPAFVTFHPNYLLRVPIAKKYFWLDLLKYFSEA